MSASKKHKFIANLLNTTPCRLTQKQDTYTAREILASGTAFVETRMIRKTEGFSVTHWGVYLARYGHEKELLLASWWSDERDNHAHATRVRAEYTQICDRVNAQEWLG